ncbi:SSI family serine proteinase inhibitor [Streptomyces lavendulae]|uniref:SSI family serine proteinase inhibitor n=1 Tax=Streptomyces lavendulae TaxID=1914 RepID=UPI0036BED879
MLKGLLQVVGRGAEPDRVTATDAGRLIIMNFIKMARRGVGAGAVCAAALLPLFPGIASAAAGQGHLSLSIVSREGQLIRSVELHCPDVNNAHPHAADACARLRRAHGEPGEVAGDNHLCSREYEPVTAMAEGEWDGQPVAWHKQYPNACNLDSETGPLFRF